MQHEEAVKQRGGVTVREIVTLSAEERGGGTETMFRHLCR